MTSSLPDVNVWLALAYAGHPHHSRAKRWFDECSDHDVLYFCRITQLGFLRLLTQRAALGSAHLTQAQAWLAFETLLLDSRVGLHLEPWDVEPRFRTESGRNEATPKLWTDDYLVAFAIAGGLTLITFDQSLAARSAGIDLLR